MLQNTLNSNAGSGWRVKNDNSIVCNPQVPSCYKAELVSPVLRGTHGLGSIFDVLRDIKRHSPSVNKSTGLHVHVGIDGGWQLPQLKRLAHNFVQLEPAFDLLVPFSRRGNSNAYCRSNRAAATAGRSKAEALRQISAARNIPALQALMCPEDSRNMKLNLMALDRHGTVEFRHACGSQNGAKVAGYVLLWVLLAEASADGSRSLAAPSKKGYAFENLLQFYSSTPVMTHWLPRRRLELNPKSSNDGRAAASSGRGRSGCSTGCACDDCRRSRR